MKLRRGNIQVLFFAQGEPYVEVDSFNIMIWWRSDSSADSCGWSSHPQRLCMLPWWTCSYLRQTHNSLLWQFWHLTTTSPIPDHHSERPQASPELELGRLRTRGTRVSEGSWKRSDRPGWPQPTAGWLPPQDGELCCGTLQIQPDREPFYCQGLKTNDFSLSAACCSNACKDAVLSLAIGLQHGRARQ